MGKIDDMEASTSEETSFKFIAPDVSNFLADPETRKMVKSRKRAERVGSQESLPSKKSKTKTIKNKNNPIEVSNRFGPLSDSEDDDVSLAESMTSATAIPTVTRRPPPIHVFYCNYAALKKSIIESVPVHRDTTFKILMNNLVVRAANIADYTRIAEFLKIKKIEYFTYNASANRPRKVLIKHLPADIDTDEVSSDLVRMGIPVQKVSNFIGRDKRPSTMYIVTVGRDHLDKVYKINRVLDFSVKIETLKPLKSIVQCHKCQRFGHVSMHCEMKPRCVKCGDNHVSSECSLKKSPGTKCKCVNCGLDHPASYRGCEAHKSAMAARSKARVGDAAAASGPRVTGPSAAGPSASAPSLTNKNFPPLKGTSVTAKPPAVNAWTGGAAASATANASGDSSPLGGLGDILDSIREFSSFFTEIKNILGSINLPELLKNIRDILQMVSSMFGNGK